MRTRFRPLIQGGMIAAALGFGAKLAIADPVTDWNKDPVVPGMRVPA